MANWYTQQEVAKLLGVSKQTVYLYAKQGKIKKIEDPFRFHREVRYEKTSVDNLLEEKRNKTVQGYRPSEVAKKLGVSVQTIYRYIREQLIETEKIPYGDEQIRHFITEKGVQQAKQLIYEKKKSGVQRFEYYDSQLDVALFQKFTSSMIPEARIDRSNSNQNKWIFYIPSSGDILSLEKGISEFNLKPAYSLHQKSLPYKGYAQLKIPKDYRHVYELVDYFYRTWGIENVRLREEERIIRLFIKAGDKPYILSTPFSEIEKFIIDGEWTVTDNTLFVRSSYCLTTVELPVQLRNYGKERAKEKGITFSQIVEEALTEYFDAQKR